MTDTPFTADIPNENYFKKAPSSFKLESAEVLLNKKNNKHYLRTLPKLVNAPLSVYNALYLTALERFAIYCQTLPAFHVNPFHFPGGFLELGIGRAYTALSIYRKEEPVNHIEPETMPAKAALWSYAIFTAALLYNVGYLVSHFWVTQCDKKGENGKLWVPFKGAMDREQGEHFRYCYEIEQQDLLLNRTSLLLARQIMPPLGFNWIASDKEIFAYWLAILENDEDSAQLMAKYVIPAEWELKEAIEQQANHKASIADGGEELDNKKFFFGKIIDKINPFNLENPAKTPSYLDSPFKNTLDSTNQETGHTFLLWLRNGIAGKSINIMRAHEGMLLISPAIFKEFVAAHPGKYSWETVYKSFVSLGYTHIIQGGSFLHQYKLGSSKEIVKGLLINDPLLITWLYNNQSLPPVNKSILPLKQIEQSSNSPNYPDLVQQGHMPHLKKT